MNKMSTSPSHRRIQALNLALMHLASSTRGKMHISTIHGLVCVRTLKSGTRNQTERRKRTASWPGLATAAPKVNPSTT
jgi:hypothetical protein